MQQRRDEILAKKAKLAELKRQRELRATQANARLSIGSASDVSVDGPGLVSALVASKLIPFSPDSQPNAR